MKMERPIKTLVVAIALTLVMITPTKGQTAPDNLLRALENSIVDIAERAKPSVVHLTIQKRPFKNGEEGTSLKDFFDLLPPGVDPDRFKGRIFPSPHGSPGDITIPAAGSGVMMSNEGYILTNNHLVEDSDKITVRITNSDEDDGEAYEATIIGRDAATDLAVVKIEPKQKLKPAKLGDSSKLKVGQWLIAIGDPYGLEKTVTVGVVSGLGRSNFRGPLKDVRYQDFIQTDASINPGNSGGPILNIDGEVVGINTFIQGEGTGIGFAIPINMAKEVYEQLLQHGEVIRGFLGVLIKDLDEGLAITFNVPGQKGALVDRVMDDSPAEKGGIQVGDVIREVDGEEVASSKELQRIISHKRPEDKAKIVLLRKGKEKKITIELAKFPEEMVIAKKPVKKNLIGISVDKIPEELARPDEKGVIITEVDPDSIAAEEGLQAGDIILMINMEEVGDVKDFQRLTASLEPGQWISLYIRRGDQMFFIAVKIPKEE